MQVIGDMATSLKCAMSGRSRHAFLEEHSAIAIEMVPPRSMPIRSGAVRGVVIAHDIVFAEIVAELDLDDLD